MKIVQITPIFILWLIILLRRIKSEAFLDLTKFEKTKTNKKTHKIKQTHHQKNLEFLYPHLVQFF